MYSSSFLYSYYLQVWGHRPYYSFPWVIKYLPLLNQLWPHLNYTNTYPQYSIHLIILQSKNKIKVNRQIVNWLTVLAYPKYFAAWFHSCHSKLIKAKNVTQSKQILWHERCLFVFYWIYCLPRWVGLRDLLQLLFGLFDLSFNPSSLRLCKILT